MSRKIERILVRVGGIWNIVTGTITLFFYSTWVRNNMFPGMNGETKGLNFLSENLNTYVITFGLVFILVGVLSIYLSNKIEDELVHKGIPLWLFIWGMVSFFTVDIIGVICYLPASFIILSKNKSIQYLNE